MRCLAADQPRLLPICLETVTGLSRLQLQSKAVNVDVCPGSCPTEGAACCKYTRWFRRTSLQCAHPVHELPASPRKALQLLRFRLGCHTCTLAHLRQANAGTRACHAISASTRTRCQHGLGDERHLVFECTKLQHIRERYARLFEDATRCSLL